MAKVIQNRRCVMCGQHNVQLWTLDNTQHAVVTYLCKEHWAPLMEVMEAAGDLAPDDQVPMPERGLEPVPTRGKRESGMAPLLDWTPPEPAPMPPEPELTAEEKLVKQALEDGKTWPQISEALGIEVLDAVEKYGDLWT
jgi:hypothetical protein